ncbi:hypothetical protein E0Z10_g4999 [Xylaria hypoxylon]|uniref:ATPase synthesis protein 25 n=1 Tax=Xylaria hypoxylon TaxID=37992 RepID=A0A4Z0YIN2_9PEZI|nr:hypothetical protein E0Z10_g4999 [Xylaria hypoxylon]
MAIARPALSAAGCSQCRLLVLNLFSSSILRPAPLTRPSLSSTRTHIVGALPIRRFSSLTKPNNPTLDPEQGQNPPVLEEEPENSEGEVAADESKPADVPWYLQVEPPTQIAPLEPAPLPEIPTNSPPLIRSLLEYASEEMGLDALTLLDMRKLDPPPALGPSLFMLFGTARSERHLNISAGRLVRWLRAKHRVHADADGLLGPNERKTKLRRKARRAKLLGTMGTDDTDDGIRTGWICVNLGTIDRGDTESTVLAEDGRVSGFGVVHTGSTIVFQIMTEGRRAEMDLETLWTRALARSLSPQGDKDSQSRVKPETNLHPVEKAMLSSLHRPSGFPGGRKGQPSGVSNQAHFYSTLQPLRSSSTTEVDPLSTSSPEELARVLTYDSHQKQRLLELLRAQLETMNASAARAALGDSSDSSQSTSSFMELIELAMETLPPTRTWEYRLAVQHKASMSGHRGAIQSLDTVGLLVEELRIYAIKATRQQYLQLLSCIFYAKEKHSIAINLALDVINTMHQRNEPIMTSDVIVSIIEGASKENDKRWARDLTTRLEKLLFRPEAPCMDEHLLMRLMTAYANQSNWNGVWNAWGVPPRHLRPRSADMYIHIFQTAFASGSLKHCTQVLRRCILEATSEEPPVLAHVGVRRAALKCIQIADPRAQEFVELPVDSQGPLARLAQREFVRLTRLLRSNI